MMGATTEKKDPKDSEGVKAVLSILKKQAPLTVKQEKYCSNACVERFLRAKGDSVRKAAKQLRVVLSWRESIGTADHLIADEFSAELAEGMAYIAGHDDDARPVMVFRIKQDYLKLRSQKSFIRLLVFTLEVAIASMARFVDQFVLLFDASFFRSPKACINVFTGILKIISDYYPGRLHKAFVIDPPSFFSCLWMGVRAFVELSAITAVVSSLDFEDPLEDTTAFMWQQPRTASLRFDSADSSAKLGSCASSRFSVTVSHLNSLKPWYLSTSTTRSAVVPTATSPSLAGATPLNARSFSFASPAARSTPRVGVAAGAAATPSKAPRQRRQQQQPRTPMPSFLQSPAMLFSFRKEGHVSRVERDRESFRPFLRFYRRPYDEIVYRARMRPPLGGLISIVSGRDQIKQRRNNKIQSFPPQCIKFSKLEQNQ
ncbi:hypothetical protein Cni_G04186 [Canna indica]|uniref:CRAL-TRIO domain-containing protein n=1 Tax=Canna indica TaxID=4628 RepID=A0AAQ3JSI5_9LILI|nr:hypothetical protein Cni_G04186 [Canna indica]